MKRKRVFFSEAAYVVGLILLALGTALMERADFGLSMVVAPAYLLHLKISQYIPAFSFGMAEYAFQAFLLLLLSLCMRRGKLSYLLSFVTAVLYGFTLDLVMALVGLLPPCGFAGRLALFAAGMLLCVVGISFFFHTYIPPEAYELFVKEFSAKTGAGIGLVKTIYDGVSCIVGIALSFAFFGLWHFEGIKLGTIVCTCLNGTLIGGCGKLLESLFDFRDALPLRKRPD